MRTRRRATTEDLRLAVDSLPRRTKVAMLEGLAAAPAPSAKLAELKPATNPRPGDPDRARELRTHPGWSWMRIVRGWDDYERALQRLESAQPDSDHELLTR